MLLDSLPPPELPLFSQTVVLLLKNLRVVNLDHLTSWKTRTARINLILSDLEGLMANRNVRSGTSKGNPPQFFFVDLTLSQDDKKSFVGWWETHQQDMPELLEMLVRTYGKTTFSYDLNGDCWICATTCNDERHQNYNCCVTSRSDDPTEAAALNLFKIMDVLGDRPWRDVKSERNWG
jgi:hypothetical protein